jgi:energy-coupling factor transporter transmembrane protein EcfT
MGGVVDQERPQMQQRIEVFAVSFNTLSTGSFSSRPFPFLIFYFVFALGYRSTGKIVFPFINSSFPILSAFFLFLRVAEFMAGSLHDDDKHLRSDAA